MNWFASILIAVLLLPSPAIAETDSPGADSYVKQGVLGLIGTGAGFFGGGLTALAFGGSDQTEYDAIGRFLIGGLVGTTFGAAGGVYLAGNDNEFEGSFSSTWAGAGAGTLAGVLWLSSFEHAHPAITAIGIAWPTVGAMLGFGSSRVLRVEPASAGGIQVSWTRRW